MKTYRFYKLAGGLLVFLMALAVGTGPAAAQDAVREIHRQKNKQSRARQLTVRG